ncbi:c-type cytochrome [Mammaliicoccus sciuri]|uniref:c-type cytochrome n=1 Tax=Sporosarcina aquimarina TaxID=114975 RepID=UPI001C8D88A8|nr:c-type cytochrome [Sporosarcina aquimarina]MBY0223687.1 c-type cytochrome [Sporosarcina aquimarina]
MKRTTTLTLGFIVVVCLVVIALMANQLRSNKDQAAESPETEAPTEKVAGIQHNPPSMEDVPDGPEGEAIKRGHLLFDDTSNVLRSEAASVEDGIARVNELSCTSCHAGAGTDEGVSSMVGMSAVYPMYIGRSGQMVTLEERINGCMVRSMDGQKFAADDEDLDAMVAYLTYISEGIPVGAELEWRHQNTIDDLPTPDVDNGEKLYQQSCIACHGESGEGTGSNTGPKLWGDGSFNDGAGIARMTKMAGYVQKNMPVSQENTLSDQEASDLAAYILSQDRPEWGNHDKDWPDGGRPNDIMTKERRDQVKDGTINWDEVLAKPEK